MTTGNRYLERLADLYPTIRLYRSHQHGGDLKPPKGTEHFLTDIHRGR